jgi:glycosyltransferase involved in cell wall biosynthesis
MVLNDRFPEHYLEAARSSTKLFEYMATGRAVLASDAGEPAHLLRDGETAWLAPNRPEAFAEKILRARADRAACAALGARLREEFEARYTHRKVMREFLAWARALPPLP